jgi:hypothetical protein
MQYNKRHIELSKSPIKMIPPKKQKKEKAKQTYSKKPKFKRRLLDHFIHGFLIFASVFVAFWLSEVRENRKNQKIIENAMENIASEMRYNHHQMVRLFNYYTPLTQALDSIINNHPESLEDLKMTQIPQWRGFHLPMLRSSAYETLINSGVVTDVPMNTANELAMLYNFQTVIERFDDSFITVLGQNPDFISVNSVLFSFSIYVEIIPELLAWYQYYGKKHLESHGYNLVVEDSILKDIIDDYRVE